MRLFASSSFGIRFGMVSCELLSATLSAVAVIPMLAILANVGAFSFVERPFSFTTKWRYR